MDFRHRKIFGIMQQLLIENDPIDVTTVILKLKQEGEDAEQDAGGVTYITKLEDNCPSSTSFSFFLETLHDLANRRALYRELQETAKLIGDKNRNAADVLEAFHKTTA